MPLRAFRHEQVHRACRLPRPAMKDLCNPWQAVSIGAVEWSTIGRKVESIKNNDNNAYIKYIKWIEMVAWDIVMVTPRSGWRAGKGCTEGPMRLVAWPKIHSVPTGSPQPDAGHSRMRDHESPRQWEWWRRIALLMSSPQVVARHTIAHTRGVKSRRVKGLWRFCMHQLCMVASGWWICCRCIWHDFTWFNVWISTAYECLCLIKWLMKLFSKWLM